MTEMVEVANILNNATDNSLVILDEVGRGTSTFDGISLAWAIAEFLHDKTKARTLFATHYHELIDLGETMKKAQNFHVSVSQNNSGIVFLRKILPGGISDSFGIEVAKLAGVPSSVIKNARTILTKLEKDSLADLPPNLFSLMDTSLRTNTTGNQKSKNLNNKQDKNDQLSQFLSENIANLDLNNFTPKQALDTLFKIKDQYEELKKT
jgi:DNA mismatch repair protein MutS